MLEPVLTGEFLVLTGISGGVGARPDGRINRPDGRINRPDERIYRPDVQYTKRLRIYRNAIDNHSHLRLNA